MTLDSQKQKEPLTQRYDRVIKVIEKSEDYRMDILGPSIIEGTPLLYWEAQAAAQAGKTLYEYRQVPMEWRALDIAAMQLSHMAEVISRHESEQYHRRKRNKEKKKNASPTETFSPSQVTD